MGSSALDVAPSRAERRNYQRVRLRIYGRFMLEDRSEHACQIVDMSPGDACLRAERQGEPGEKVIAYLDHVGRVEGVVTRLTDDGFAMTILASERKREKLAAQITWLANRHELNLPEDRRHERVTPRNTQIMLQLEDGRQYRSRILDLSLSGAAIELQVRPAIGMQVALGTMRGRIVRHFADGVAIEFTTFQNQDALQTAFGLPDADHSSAP